MPGKGDVLGGGFDWLLVVVVSVMIVESSSDDAEKKRRCRVKSALLTILNDDDLRIVRLDRLDNITIEIHSKLIFALSITESTRRETESNKEQ